MDVPDGYVRYGERGLRLVDPADCPAGHQFAFGTRGGTQRCPEHGPHLWWRCACGQRIYRLDGGYVGTLPCRRLPEPGPRL